MSINTLTISGNLGQDPSMKYLQSGKVLASGTIAVSGFKGGEKTTLWVYYTAFDKKAELMGEYCKKGNTVTLSGRLDIEEWTTQEGQKRQKTCIIVHDIQLPGKHEVAPKDRDLDADDIPF